MAGPAGRRRQKLKAEMLTTEIFCLLASWREKFMSQLRVADVSRKGCQPRKLSGQEARRRFPGLASWRWILHADWSGGGGTKTGFPLFCFLDFCFLLSQFLLSPWGGPGSQSAQSRSRSMKGCASEVDRNAGASPARRVRLFTTEHDLNSAAARRGWKLRKMSRRAVMKMIHIQ